MDGYTFTGGDRLNAKLKEIAARIGKATRTRVGFLEGSNQPDGTPNAYIALIQEYGATIQVNAHSQIIYRKPRRLRKGSKGNRFVKATSKGAVAKEVDVGEHTITIPARPFFRMMIAQNKDTWGPRLAVILKQKNYDAAAALKLIGEEMGDQLQNAIDTFSDPPNAKSTIRKKKFNSPLIDHANMRNGVGSDVS